MKRFIGVNGMNELTKIIRNELDKVDINHTHDNLYYTKDEIDTKLAAKSDTSHTHSYIPLSDITRSNGVTTGQKVLDAVEKNPSISGTLAKLINDNYNALVYKTGEVVNRTYWEFGFGFANTDQTIFYLLFPLNKRLTKTPSAVNITKMMIYGDNNLYSTESGNIKYTMNVFMKQMSLYLMFTFDSKLPIFSNTGDGHSVTAQIQYTMTV